MSAANAWWAAFKPELRCSNGPPAFVGAESGFAGATKGLCLGCLVIPLGMTLGAYAQLPYGHYQRIDN
jgi:hypothetical protein